MQTLYDALQTFYDALEILHDALYNALQRSKHAPKHQLVVANAITSGNLAGNFQEPSGNLSETFHSSSGDRLDIFRNIPGAITAVRFYFRVASGTSSGFPSGSFRDPSGNVHFEAMI